MGLIGLAVWGTLRIASSKLQAGLDAFENQSWAGDMVLLQASFNGSNGSILSRDGNPIGNLSFASTAMEWTIDFQSSLEPFQSIVYQNLSFNSFGVTKLLSFNATCFTPNNTLIPCLSGLLQIEPPYNPNVQQINYNTFNLTMTSLTNQLNFPSNALAWTSGPNFQGIYPNNLPPLGSWYVDNNVVLQMIWSPNGDRACEGLIVNLSQTYAVIAWPILGVIWGYWIEWGISGGCNWT
jgi:hypothetical protein